MWIKKHDGKNNVCGQKLKKLRENRLDKTSQRKMADLLQMEDLDIEKNPI